MDYIVTLSEEEEKALLTDMVTVQAWLNNAIHNKARQCIDDICKQALEDSSNTILTTVEKREIATSLASSGRIISTVKGMPEKVKMDIVSKARVKSAAERQTEIEALQK